MCKGLGCGSKVLICNIYVFDNKMSSVMVFRLFLNP